MISCLLFFTRKVKRVNKGDPETRARRYGPAERPTSRLNILTGTRDRCSVLSRSHVDSYSLRHKGFSLLPSYLLCFSFAHDEEEPEPKFLKGAYRNLIAPHMGNDDNSAGPAPCYLHKFLPALGGCGHFLVRAHFDAICIGSRKGVKLAPGAVQIVQVPATRKDHFIKTNTGLSP